VLTELRTQVAQRFREEGIEIPFPQRDLHVRSLDEEALRALAERDAGKGNGPKTP